MTPRQPRPAYLNPKATHLPEGHDDTLDPSEPPTPPEARSKPPNRWPATNGARGGTEPPEAPLAPPGVDPSRRTLAPFEWPTGPTRSNRPMAELVPPLGDLDPDVAFWPVTILQRWPFSGPPTVGVWPKGWVGVDNTAGLYICTASGEPGTWELVTTGGRGPAGSQGPPGVPGAAGAAGPAGPAGPAGMDFVSELVLAAEYDFTGGAWTDPVESQEVAGNGIDRYRIIAQGVFGKGIPGALPGYSGIGIARSDLGHVMNSTLSSVGPEEVMSFFLELTDVPPTTCSYWMMAYSTDTGPTALLAGARMTTWKIPGG